MGIVRNQAIKNSFFSYIGVALGYVNLILLFPNFFSTEQFGLIQLLISVAEVYALVSAVGLANSVTKFFPYYKTDDKHHNGFLTYLFLISFSGFIIASIIYLLFRPLIISAYIQKSAMFVDYYFILIPFALFSLMFNVFEATARAVFRTSFATFVREVALRVLTTAGIFLFMYKILDFHSFVIYYILIYFVCAILIFIQIIITREYSFTVSLKYFQKTKLSEILKYGGFTLISGAAMQTGLRIPALMIGSMVGLSMVGVYNLYYYVGSMIYVPMRALSRISVPVIATAWRDNDLKKINDIYRRTSLIQLILGLIIYIGVIINKHNLFYFLKNSEYVVNFIFFPIIGLGILIDVAVGLNSEIIVNSPKYKYDSVFNVVLFLVSVIANYILIPISGGIGAAMGFVLAYFSFNFLKWLFLYRKYGMQPFDYKQLIVLFLGAVVFLIGDNIPVIDNVFLDIIVRSSVVSLIYGVAILVFRISPDLNERFTVYKGKFIKK